MVNPSVEIDLGKLAQNAKAVIGRCTASGIDVAGVVKVTSGDIHCARVVAACGCHALASSRLDHLIRLKAADLGKPLMCIRIPMISEAPELVRVADISLNSDIDVLRALNRASGDAGVRHGVILMIELGDLREGFWEPKSYVSAAMEVEQVLDHLDLLGVGTNLSCYGSIAPTAEKLQELVVAAERVETAIGRRLEYISGGGSIAFMRVLDGDMPPRINHLRIGEAILVNKDNEDLYDHTLPDMHRDVFTLKAEVVESRVKPTYPIGEFIYDAFRNVPVYEDFGDRRRAILAMGKADYGYPDQITPRNKGVRILGGSSDHTLLDIEGAEDAIHVGDVLSFDLNYVALLYVMASQSVAKIYLNT